MNTPLGTPNSIIEFLSRSQVIASAGFNFTRAYGSFSSSLSQILPIVPNVYTATYTTTDLVGGGMILNGGGNSILIPIGGTYRVITSIQLDKGGGGGSVGDVFVWFAVDGVAVPNSATKSQLTNLIETVMTVEVLVSCFAGQLISIQLQGATGTERIFAEPASNGRPAIPSIITIVQRVA